jgi:hypothetical protein
MSQHIEWMIFDVKVLGVPVYCVDFQACAVNCFISECYIDFFVVNVALHESLKCTLKTIFNEYR